MATIRNARQMVRSRVWELVLDGQQATGKRAWRAGYPDAVLVDILANQGARLWDIRAVIDEVTGELFSDGVTPCGWEFLTFDRGYQRVTDLVCGMMDPGVRKMMDGLYRVDATSLRHCPVLSEYNLVVRNREVFSRMLDEAPGVVRFYCLFLDPGANRPGREAGTGMVFEYPREVTEIVKVELGLGPGQRRYFTRLWEGVESIPDKGADGLGRLLRNVRLRTRFLADVNRPKGGRGALIKAAKLDHGYCSQACWRQGDPWRAWVHLANQFLATDSDESAASWMSLDGVADALRWHIEHDPALGSGRLAGLRGPVGAVGSGDEHAPGPTGACPLRKRALGEPGGRG